MYRIKLNLITRALLVLFLNVLILGCKKDSPKPPAGPPKFSAKEILTFEFFSADNPSLPKDYNSAFDGNSITATLPATANLKSLKSAFTISEKATALVGATVQTSQVSANDFTRPVTYTIKAEDGSTKTYVVTINH